MYKCTSCFVLKKQYLLSSRLLSVSLPLASFLFFFSPSDLSGWKPRYAVLVASCWWCWCSILDGSLHSCTQSVRKGWKETSFFAGSFHNKNLLAWSSLCLVCVPFCNFINLLVRAIFLFLLKKNKGQLPILHCHPPTPTPPIVSIFWV